MYAMIAQPMYRLIIEFIWIQECEESLKKIKEDLTSTPILKSPDWTKVFHVHIDASSFAIGCTLAQLKDNYMDFPIIYASRQLNSKERNYKTIEREGLSMVYAIKKF